MKRNEVVNWCDNVVYLDPPPCWAAKRISDSERIHNESEDADEDNTGWYEKLTQLRRRKVICIGLAEQLWKKYPGLSYEEMHEYPAMKELGYSTKFQFNNFKKLVRPVASEPAKLGGRRSESKA